MRKRVKSICQSKQYISDSAFTSVMYIWVCIYIIYILKIIIYIYYIYYIYIYMYNTHNSIYANCTKMPVV